jgi:hypothetical protein
MRHLSIFSQKIPDNGTIDSWLPLEQNREQWKTLGTEWIKHQQALTIYQGYFAKIRESQNWR